MAARLPVSPLSSHPYSFSKLGTRELKIHEQPWLRKKPKRFAIRAVSSLLLFHDVSDLANHVHQNSTSLILLADSVGYSVASYYTSLGLFVISLPGLWSLIKRSVKSKIVQKTYIKEAEGSSMEPNLVAGEILSYFTRNNFVVLDRGETITYVRGPYHQHLIFMSYPQL